MSELKLGLVFDTGPFPLKGETTIPVKKAVKDPKTKGC